MVTFGRALAWGAVLLTATSIAFPPAAPDASTTVAPVSSALEAIHVIAALAVSAAAATGLLLQPGRPGLVALALAGAVWTAQDWAGWQDGPNAVRVGGLLLSTYLVPLLIHAVVAGAGRPGQVRALVATLYAAATAFLLVLAFAYDPFLDVDCWDTCTIDNFLLASARPGLIEVATTGWLIVIGAAGVTLMALALSAFVTATGPARRVHGPTLVVAAVLGCLMLFHSVMGWQNPKAGPISPLDTGLYVAVAGSTVLVAGAWVYGPLLDRWTRRMVADLVAGLGRAAEAGTVERALATATRDPSLRLVYRLPSSAGYADARGRVVDPPRSCPGAVPVLRDGQEVGAVLHDPATATADQVQTALGNALLLALDNERLRAEGLAQLSELRASRARVVSAADAERRQLERNLHDGAQQRMLALSFDLRRAVGDAHDGSTRRALTAAEAEVRAALVELRELAHGIYPATLEEAGLEAALATLAANAPLPVEVRGVGDAWLPADVARTAYVVVSDAVAIASADGADCVDVTLLRERGQLVIEMSGVGRGHFVSVEDRVAGSGGHVDVQPDRLKAVIPCA